MTINRQEEERRLRLSKEVRIGELVAALVAISALATGYIELRLKPIQEQIVAVKEAGREAATATVEFKRELRADMQRLEAKLDRLIEALPIRGGGR